MSYNQDEILKLSVEERIQLVETIWESIDEDTLPTNESEWQLAKERYELYLKNPTQAIPWEQLKNQLLSKYAL